MKPSFIIATFLLSIALPCDIVWSEDPLAPSYSVWLVESGKRSNVPVDVFLPSRKPDPGRTQAIDPPASLDLPIIVGVIKGPTDVVLFDTGGKDPSLREANRTTNWAPLPDQLKELGINTEDVTMIVIGNAHWDRAGQIDEFPNATLYIQRRELAAIEWALNYPKGRNSDTTREADDCFRPPTTEYSIDVLDQIYRKILAGKAVIVDGELEIAPGLEIYPAYCAHTPGSQLLRVKTNTHVGSILFGGGVLSSLDGMRERSLANPQQTDSDKLLLAYDQCSRLTAGSQYCIAGYEPKTFTRAYPLTMNSWVALNGSRMAQIVLAPGDVKKKNGGGGRHESSFPEFPWPPPRASADGKIPPNWLLEAGKPTRLSDVASTLEQALRSAKYRSWSYSSVPNGFALVTQFEQIRSDGTPSPEPARWSAGVPSARDLTLVEFIKALLNAQPGYYRVIVFIVTDQPWERTGETPTGTQAKRWLVQGLEKLPRPISTKIYGPEYKTSVFVYEFIKASRDVEATYLERSEWGVSDHLKKAGIFDSLSGWR